MKQRSNVNKVSVDSGMCGIGWLAWAAYFVSSSMPKKKKIIMNLSAATVY